MVILLWKFLKERQERVRVEGPPPLLLHRVVGRREDRQVVVLAFERVPDVRLLYRCEELLRMRVGRDDLVERLDRKREEDGVDEVEPAVRRLIVPTHDLGLVVHERRLEADAHRLVLIQRQVVLGHLEVLGRQRLAEDVVPAGKLLEPAS